MAKFFDKSPQPDDEFGWARYGDHAKDVMYAEWLAYRHLEPRMQELVPSAAPAVKAPPPCFSEDDYEASRYYLNQR